MANYEAYSGVTMQIQIIEPELDGVRITSADTSEWTLLNPAGIAVGSGALSYSAELPVTGKEGWFGNFTLPDTKKVYHLHSVLTKSGANWKGHDTITARDFS